MNTRWLERKPLRRAWMIGAAGLLGLSPAALAVDFPEMEPNDTKAAAQVISGMAPGDTITGFSTGSSTTAAGPGSADYYDVTTTSAGAPGIYRYELTITTAGTAGHVSTIRGLTQTAGVINPGTDATIQTALTTASGVIPARTVVWYANENPSRIIYRVTGTASTTADYVATLNRTAVVPALGPSLIPGSITIARSGHTNDTDFWVYDAVTGAAVPDFGNDDPNTMTRSFSAGDYILAISNFNLANNQPAATGETFLSGAVMDYDNAVAGSSTASTTNLAMSIGGSAVPLTKTHAFQIMFVYFQVAVPLGPYFTAASATPNPVGQSLSTVLSATVANGPNGPATSVTGDLTAFGLSAAEAFSDPEPDGIWTYTLNVPLAQPTGPYGVALTATDSAAQTGSGSVNFQVSLAPPANDLCVNAQQVTLGNLYVANANGATNDTNVDPTCDSTAAPNPPVGRFGVWYRYNSAVPCILTWNETGTTDIVISFWTGPDCNSLSQAGCDVNEAGSFNITPNTDYYILVSAFSSTAVPTVAGNYSITFDCVQPAANDLCSNAIPVGVGTVSGTFVGSANDGSATCGASATSVDVWYSFTSPFPGDLVVTTCGTHDIAGTDASGIDTVVSFHFGCPGVSGNQITTTSPTGGCDDDAGPPACPAGLPGGTDIGTLRDSVLTYSGYPGNQTVVIRVARFSSSVAAGQFFLNVGFTPSVVVGRCCLNGLGPAAATCVVTDSVNCGNQGGSFGGAATACDGWTNDPFTNNPTVCCPANFNSTGGVSVQDIYDFLTDWSSQSAGGPIIIRSADINGVGGVTVQDVYDFLSAWSAGCPALP